MSQSATASTSAPATTKRGKLDRFLDAAHMKKNSKDPQGSPAAANTTATASQPVVPDGPAVSKPV